MERKAIRPRRTLMIKKLKSSKSKTYRRKSGKDRDKSRHAFKGDDHEPIYTALVRKDNSDSHILFLFSLQLMLLLYSRRKS